MPLKIRFRHTSPVLWSIHRGSRGGGVSASRFEDQHLNQPPAFQFYVDNFVQGTCDMEPAEVGVYMRLLCYQWSNGAIPAEKGRLFRVAGGEVSEHVMAKFVKGSDGMLRNERMEIERQKQKDYREACSKGGRKGGGNPNFKKGQQNPYYAHKGRLSSTLSLKDKGKINTPSPSPSPSPSYISDLQFPAPACTRGAQASDSGKRIEEIHLWYSETRGGDIRLDEFSKRLWFEFFKAGHTEDDFKRVFKSKNGMVLAGDHPAAIHLKNLLAPDRFPDFLADAKNGAVKQNRADKLKPKSLAEKDLDKMLQ